MYSSSSRGTVVEYIRGRHFKSFLENNHPLNKNMHKPFSDSKFISSLGRTMVEGWTTKPRVAGSSLTHSRSFFCLTCIFTGSNPKYANFKGQKHYDSPELTIPDFSHLNSYFMENILAYTNPTHRNTLKMSFYYSKTNFFGG